MFGRHIERTLANIRRKPLRHVATALALAVAFLVFGGFFVGWWALSSSVERWGGAYEVTIYVSDTHTSGAGLEALRAMLGAQPEVSRVTYVPPEAARRRLGAALPEGAGIADLPSAAFPASFELRLREDSREPAAVGVLADRLRDAPGIASVETYGPWIERLSRVAGIGRVAAVVLGLVVLAVAFVIVGFHARLSRAERREETELLRIVGATSSYVEIPLVLEGALQGLVGALTAVAGVALGLLVLGGLAGTTVTMPPVTVAVLFTLAGAAVGALAARRTAVQAS